MPKISKTTRKTPAAQNSSITKARFKCCCCGTEYAKQIGNFPTSQSLLYRGNNGYRDNYIYISANNRKLINKSFELFLYAKGYEEVPVTVTIRASI